MKSMGKCKSYRSRVRILSYCTVILKYYVHYVY
jgi:hypothetical protein